MAVYIVRGSSINPLVITSRLLFLVYLPHQQLIPLEISKLPITLPSLAPYSLAPDHLITKHSFRTNFLLTLALP